MNRVQEEGTVFSYSGYESLEGEIRDWFSDDSHRSLYWCSRCDVPLLTPTCYRCLSHGRRFVTDVKPVFEKERHFLEEACQRELPAGLYTSRGRLYHKGRLLMSLVPDNEHMRVAIDHADSLLKEMVRTDGVASLQSAVVSNKPVLRYLEQQAMDAIAEVASEYPDRRPVVSFSGGKDSAVVAHLVARAIGATREVSLFFADTTLEHPETVDYVQRFAEYYGLPLAVERANGDFLKACEQLEPPSRIMRWCCTLFKANPLNTYLRRQGDVLSFDGIRRGESNRRRTYTSISGNKKALQQLVFRPILDWSSLAVWLYISAYGIPYNPAYDKGYARVGCVICPFSTEYNDLLTGRYYPDKVRLWQDLLKRYFVSQYADKFDPEVADQWIREGLWKGRKVHHRNQRAAVRTPTCQPLNEYTYHIGSGLDAKFLEFLKPLGDVKFMKETGFFTVVDGQNLCISGMLGDGMLAVTFNGSTPRRTMYLLERQVKKAMNCVKCGACAGMCPSNAIEIQPMRSFRIDETKCNHCLNCVRADFTHYGCVALSYKRERNWIEEA